MRTEQSVGEFHIIKEYDFRNPKKFTKEHQRDLNTLNENIVRMLATNLSGILRVFCEAKVVSVTEKKYSEFAAGLPEKTLMSVIGIAEGGVEEDQASLLLHVSSVINFFMIDKLLGGTGEGNYFKRGYTEIETEILKYFYDKITHCIQEAWSTLMDVRLKNNQYETNPRLIQSFSADESVIVIDYEINLGETYKSTINVCIPAMCLDDFLVPANVYNQYAFSKHYDAKQKTENILAALGDTNLEMKAILGTVQLDMHDIITLSEGDVIPLDTRTDDNIIIEVDSVPWFSAKLGEYKIKKAVKICGNVKTSDKNKSAERGKI